MIVNNDEDTLVIGVNFNDFQKEAEPHYRELMAIASCIIAQANKEAEAIEDIKLKEYVLCERSTKARTFSSYCLMPFIIDTDHFDATFELMFLKHFLGNRLKHLCDYNIAFKMKFMRSLISMLHENIFEDINEEEAQEGASISMDALKENLDNILKKVRESRNDDEPIKH